MKLDKLKKQMDDIFGDRHEHISSENSCKFKELDRNTIIITALTNYYDYNELSNEEGREVLQIIQDISKTNMDFFLHDTELMKHSDLKDLLERLIILFEDNEEFEDIGKLINSKDLLFEIKDIYNN